MIVSEISNYLPKNEQEQKDKKLIEDFIKHHDDAFLRSNLAAHFTVSTIILNNEKTKVLFGYHLIYKSWAWLGGHNDGDMNFLNVAIKEAKEESGLTEFKILSEKPLMLDVINVKNHYKNNEYVPDHLHLNLTYFLEADEKSILSIKKDENSGLKWILITDLFNYVDEERMIPIYTKAISIIEELI